MINCSNNLLKRKMEQLARTVWMVTKDMRLEDNLTLKRALQNSSQVFPVFVLDRKQIDEGGSNSVIFMLESLLDLNQQLNQYNSCIHVVDKSNLQSFIHENHISDIFMLAPFTDFEKSRKKEYRSLTSINMQGEKTRTSVTLVDDCLGLPRESFLKSDGTPYKVFTPYSRHVLRNGGLDVPDQTIPIDIHKCGKIEGYSDFDFLSLSATIKLTEAKWKGGSTEGKRICEHRKTNLEIFLEEQECGHSTRKRRECGDISPHLKFGTVSPRLVYHCGLTEAHKSDWNNAHVEGKGVMWRALYYNLMDQNMVVLKNRQIPWYDETVSKDEWGLVFDLWTSGNTGFDFVDAGIHQLLRTGLMDNEVRMLVASFLVFVNGINWRKGEQFFRQHLVDYDWPLNAGNWAWVAQVGMDNPSPNKTYDYKPIRIFNPNTYMTKNKKQKEYREGYIKKWLLRKPNSIQQSCNFEKKMRYWLQFY